MESEFKSLENQDFVISFDPATFKSVAFMSLVYEAFERKGMDELRGLSHHRGYGNLPREDGWLRNGIPCEILRSSSPNWQKGKMRFKVVLEFCPDEPEINPLDELRS